MRRMNLWTSLHKHSNPTPLKAYIGTMVFASLLGTYLDLWLVGKGLYSFPLRPFPKVFSIDIFFALCILPLSTLCLLYVFDRIGGPLKIVLGIGLSLAMAILEQVFEQWGLFVHSGEWRHVYSFFGYLVFIMVIWNFYKWFKK